MPQSAAKRAKALVARERRIEHVITINPEMLGVGSERQVAGGGRTQPAARFLPPKATISAGALGASLP